MKRLVGPALALAMLMASALPAAADNPMGYRLLSEQEAGKLPRSHGVLGISVGRAQQIVDAGMTFDIMRVTAVRPGSPAAQAGLHEGDQIIAVNGRVFSSLKAFAAYMGSMEAGSVASIDYMPSDGGPAQAQRVAVTVGDATQPTRRAERDRQAQGGLSTGTKLAIGAGAVALFGCYELGCFSHRQGQAQ
ncbi:MAG TPA: PDZ domain-containing protein [Rhodopila sp.]